MTANSFNRLEKLVKKVSARVKELEKDNEKLRLKAAKLENTLRDTPNPEEGEAWAAEKAQVREQVEHLSDHLEAVLEASEAADG